jgi:hypothetical protein
LRLALAGGFDDSAEAVLRVLKRPLRSIHLDPS